MNKAAGGPVNPQPMTKDNSMFVVKRVKFCGYGAKTAFLTEGGRLI